MTGSRFVVYLIWLLLLGAALWGFLTRNYVVAFVGVGTFLLTLTPMLFTRFTKIEIPTGFVAAIAAFLCGTLFLGEVGQFYERYWWWDVVLHTGSAVAFGLVGVVLMLMLIQGNKVKASPLAIAFFAFCFAVMIGAVWEIHEFTMDQIFGSNMQKSGLVDTMWDLIVDCIGAMTGAAAGYAYLKGRHSGPLAASVRDFVESNPRLFGGSDEG